MSGDVLHGRVTDFDAAAGLGTIESEAGEAFRFHCVEIAGGSRTIELGAGVAFTRLAKLGCIEAAGIVKLSR